MPTATPNDSLRIARVALNLGQADLAEAINRAGVVGGAELRCEVRQIAKWEAGEVSWPQARYRRALEAVFGVPCHMLGFREPASLRGRGSPASVSGEEEDVFRRQFLTNAVKLAASASLAPLLRFGNDSGTAVYVEATEQTLAEIQSLERKVGSGNLLPVIERQIQDLETRLQTGDDSSAVKRVAAWAYMLGGWMHFDTNKQTRARSLYKEALFLAQMSGDRIMVARLAGVMSMQSSQLQRPHEAVQFARLGASQFPSTGPVAALLAVREARGWGRLQEKREARAAIARAHDALSASGPAPDWVSFFTAGELDGASGHLAMDLGDWDEAEALARKSMTDPALPMRAKASFQTSLISTLIARRDLSEASKEIDNVVPMLATVSSPRVSELVRGVVASLPKIGHLGEQRERLAAYA